MSRRVGVKLKVRLQGQEDAKKAMREYSQKLGGDPEAIVGFGTNYALAVHERVEVFHNTGGPLFLKSAFDEELRGYKRDLARREKKLEAAGHPRPLAGAINQKALRVEAKAVRRTPVDTGRLRASHFVAEAK
ncbi:MAG: hypothetical protein ACXADY_25905 [Candidatus Hodarchaeales archaeon]|jgi:hypothetical protein